MNDLTDIGFKEVGNWHQDGDSISFNLRENPESENLLYSFVSENKVLYVGKTTRGLAKRMYGYKNPGPTQRTNIRINGEIKNLVSEDMPVRILALTDNGLLHFGKFHLNIAAGLEDSIIATLSPPWNCAGNG